MMDNKKDWREELPPVRDTELFNCCWAVASVEATEFAYSILKGKTVNLSPQELIDHFRPTDPEEWDNGGGYGYFTHKCFKYIAKKGLYSEKDYPFTKKIQPLQTINKKRSKVSIKSYREIDIEDEEALKGAVDQQPVCIDVQLYDNFHKLKKGIYMGPRKQGDKSEGGHSLLLVGYGVEVPKYGRKPRWYWIVRNNWGEKWGENGYGRICMTSSMPKKRSLISFAYVPVLK